jgi:hypothetical protein
MFLVADLWVYRLLKIRLADTWTMLEPGALLNFDTFVQITGVSEGQAWSMLAVVALTLGLGFGLPPALDRITRRLRWVPTTGQRIAIVGLAAVIAVGTQVAALASVDQFKWALEQQRAPLYVRLFRARSDDMHVLSRFRSYTRHDEAAQAAPLPPGYAASPDTNLFLFIIETLRDDFVTPEIAPHLADFKRENISFDHAQAASNATHLSWYSILASDDAVYMPASRLRRNPLGSPPMIILQRAGFKVRFYSRALELLYLDNRENYFGKDGRLLAEAVGNRGKDVTEEDRYTIQKFEEAIAAPDHHGPNLWIVTLNSTHHEYAWPSDFRTTFLPVAAGFDYLRTQLSPEEVDKIRNRYKNSLQFVDQLFGRAIAAIRGAGLYEKSAIAVVGDHGEEFLEHGALIHGSNLFAPQIQSGLYLRLPGAHPPSVPPVFSPVHILPTLLDTVGLYDTVKPFVVGRSLLRGEPRLAWTLSCNASGLTACRKFMLNNGHYKLHFESDTDTFAADGIIISDIYDENDQPQFPTGDKAMLPLVAREFGPALSQLPIFAAAPSLQVP